MRGNPHPTRPFVKGDPRINRKGRPKTFGALRELAQAISHELVLNEEAEAEGRPVVLASGAMTQAEKILREWANSDNPQLQIAFMQYAFGKVPDKTELGAEENTEVVLKVVRGVSMDDL